MGSVRTISIRWLTLCALAGCASSRPMEQEPVDPTITASSAPVEESESTDPVELPVPVEGACPESSAPLTVKLLVLMRHPTDPVPPLPADGFVLTVDGKPAATGLRVGKVHTVCVEPGEHEVAAVGSSSMRSVRVTAPGKANLAVAGGGDGPVPGLPPGRTTPGPEMRP